MLPWLKAALWMYGWYSLIQSSRCQYCRRRSERICSQSVQLGNPVVLRKSSERRGSLCWCFGFRHLPQSSGIWGLRLRGLGLTDGDADSQKWYGRTLFLLFFESAECYRPRRCFICIAVIHVRTVGAFFAI
ncbi:hypothetical protein TRVL_05382 [Trypanosoma vivax]|uniref:Secreted protein n=1 Tax=Trypanosoma vivax (strain Y486) TaxID=1055687 RepID=G0U0D6_TRYVY|nr:hypothetical protein TRVL_05382 [Trypanosoma vivax]CCC49534.1 hypothetical protein, unlikely [Trypanosoma vivax Y486]